MHSPDERLSRRGLIVGLAALTASCATSSPKTSLLAMATTPPPPPVAPPLTVPPVALGPSLDPKGLIRRPLMHAALDALKRHKDRVPHEDRIYIVDFQQHSSRPRLFRLDLVTGEATAFRTAHGRGSDPSHTGFAQRFSNTPNSNASSVGAYVTAGASAGAKHGPNVLLDGLELTNSQARDRAIIVHAADYCEPAYVAQHGKLGRSYGCFSLSRTDLVALRPEMDAGRLLFAGI
ncbi:MAG: murein L,D-transpeptidase catalytic domain family protein [Caulobacter sp.]|nr:murein L,D-transpeptidase catalytic domain family protein [Caulobacter sp.]